MGRRDNRICGKSEWFDFSLKIGYIGSFKRKTISKKGYLRFHIYLRTNKIFFWFRPSTFTADEGSGNFLFNLGTPSAVTIYSMYLRLKLSTTPYLKFCKSKHCSVLDPITSNCKAIYFLRILDRFTRMAKPIRMIGDADNKRPDTWSSTVLIHRVKEFFIRLRDKPESVCH